MIYLPGDKVDVDQSKIDRIAIQKRDNSMYATVVGTIDDRTYVPLEIAYRAKIGDNIVGFVVMKRSVGYFIDSGTAYTMIVLNRELQGELRMGNIISARISRVEDDQTVILNNVRRLKAGKIVEVPSSKVPRIIGKDASMIKLIKEKTNCDLFVGANGYVYITDRDKNANVSKAIAAIRMIVRMSHLHSLTDIVEKFLGE